MLSEIDALLLVVRTRNPDDETSRENVDVVHSGGTHGVEGYAGSAVQARFLNELFLQNEELIRAGPRVRSPGEEVRRVLLIHSMNPYGMRHHRHANGNIAGSREASASVAKRVNK